jgi:hypothetical protein
MKHLPIWRDATQLLLEIEKAVMGFPRYHKYTLGTDLRQQAMGIVRLIHRAYHEQTHRTVGWGEARIPTKQRIKRHQPNTFSRGQFF